MNNPPNREHHPNRTFGLNHKEVEANWPEHWYDTPESIDEKISHQDKRKEK